MDKFKLENLGSGITAVISKEHGFGTDAPLVPAPPLFCSPTSRQ